MRCRCNGIFIDHCIYFFEPPYTYIRLTWEYSRIYFIAMWLLSCVGITMLLSMTVFQLIIADKVPESSQAIPLLGTTIIVIHTLCSEKNHPLSFSSISPWKMFRFIQNFQGMFKMT